MVEEEVWGKVHAAVGDSCSLAMALPRGIGFRGFRGSVCGPRPGKAPHMAIRWKYALRVHLSHNMVTCSIPTLPPNIDILHSNVSNISFVHTEKSQAKRLQLLAAEQKHEVCRELQYVCSTRMANLGAGLRADGLPAVQAEQPEGSPRWALPAEENRVQGHFRVKQSEDVPCGGWGQQHDRTARKYLSSTD